MSVSIPQPQFMESSSTNGNFACIYTGNLYFVTLAQVGESPNDNHRLVIWKSTDTGATWSRIVNDVTRAGSFFTAALTAGGVLHLIVQPTTGSGPLRLYRFNLAADAFLTDDLAGPTDWGGSLVAGRQLMAAAYTDGRILIAYKSNVSGFGYRIWAASAWSAFNVVDLTSIGLAADWIVKETASERMHLFAIKSTGVLYHVSVEDGGALGTMQLLPVGAGTIAAGVGTGAPAITAGRIVFPYVISSGGTSLRVLRAAPAANPAWIDELIPTAGLALVSGDLAFSWFIPYAVAFGTKIAVTFAVNTFGGAGFSGAQGWIYASQSDLDTGGWSTVAIAFTAPSNAVVASHYAVALDATQYGFVVPTVNLPLFFGVGTKFSALALWWEQPDSTSPGVPIPPAPLPLPLPTIDCGSPPAGTVGIAYSHSLPNSQASEFYTITITSGAIPAGLSMSNAGAITGTPILPGVFTFTATITDSYSQSASVTCSITISSPTSSGGDNVAF
jgi:hypothetical protein